MRIHEFAKKINKDSKDIIAILQANEIEGKKPASSISESEMNMVLEKLQPEKKEETIRNQKRRIVTRVVRTRKRIITTIIPGREMTTETMAAAIMTETEETTIITVIIITEITAITIITAIIIEITIIITAITMAAITNRTIMQRIVPVRYLLRSRRRKKKSR